MGYDPLTSLRIIAIRNVLNAKKPIPLPDEEYLLRHIFRWYSKTFSTPLHQVLELPTEEVVLNYYEDLYEQKEQQELEDERELLIEDPEELKKRQLAEDEADVMAFEDQKEVERELMANPIKPRPGLEQVQMMKEASSKLMESLKEFQPNFDPAPRSKLPSDISFSFSDSDEEVDLDMDSLGILDDPKKQST